MLKIIERASKIKNLKVPTERRVAEIVVKISYKIQLLLLSVLIIRFFVLILVHPQSFIIILIIFRL
jgi:hypothetical protein